MQKYQDVVDIIAPPGLVPIRGANVKVLIHGTTTSANIFSDNSSTVTANPLTTDNSGRYSFYAADGRYDLQVSGTGLQTTTLTDIVLSDTTPNISNVLASSSGASNIGFIQSGTGAVATTLQGEARRFVYPEQFGAVGDGVTDDSSALQKAINTNRPIRLQAGKNYLFNTALDCTNRSSAGIYFYGGMWGEGTANAILTANTGGVGIDCTGTQYAAFRNVAIVSGSGNPSTLGILLARSTTSQFAQFSSFKNVRVSIATNIAKFGGRGTVAIYNNAAEIGDFENVYAVADNALVCLSVNDFGVSSVYQTIGGPTSASRVRLRGGNNTLKSLNASAFALWCANCIDMDFDAYFLGTGTGSAIYLIGCTKIKIRGHVESFSRSVFIGNGNNYLDIELDKVHGANSPFLCDTSTFVGINFSNFTAIESFGAATAAPYLVEGAVTHQLRWSTVKSILWSPATSYTNINNLTDNDIYINGTSHSIPITGITTSGGSLSLAATTSVTGSFAVAGQVGFYAKAASTQPGSTGTSYASLSLSSGALASTLAIALNSLGLINCTSVAP